MRLNRSSLSFRLAVVINLTALAVLIAFGVHNYERERRVHLEEQADRLREEARVLHVAQLQLATPEEFQLYVDAYCQQMERHVSPGHHIAVLDPRGEVLVRAHTHADDQLESEMAVVQGGGTRRFSFMGQEFMVVGIPSEGDSTILVTQSLAPVKRVIRRQAVSRVTSMSTLVVLLMVITNWALWRWVRRPIGRLVEGVENVRQRHFQYRIDRLSTSELQFLADGFNRMTASLEEAEIRRQRELEKARRIHFGLLPPDTTAVPGLSIAARYMPADSIGGDYHDLLPYPDGQWLILVADVSGHGLSAALIASMLKALLRQAVRQNMELETTADLLNHELQAWTGTEHFVTCLLARYTPDSGELQYLSCGHEAALIVNRAQEPIHVLESTGLPLGVDADTEWTTGAVSMNPGDRLCLVTDGLAESSRPDGSILGREETLRLLLETADAPPSEQIIRILQRVEEIHGRRSFDDDVTVVILERVASPREL